MNMLTKVMWKKRRGGLANADIADKGGREGWENADNRLTKGGGGLGKC